ncbi:ribbon-helix-helix protein, CopG family [Agrobacterium sp. CCNWLW71]|uniref:ribbon-helix-helix protein, CopG family n=1 Tax=Agrobacterium sp. CCNWLW71 TaxID=3122066 RepID=UPI00300FCB91
MSKNDIRTARVRESVAALRARQAAAGFVNVSIAMPGDVVAEIDRLKQERGASSRAPILEEAVRFYLEQTRA